MAPLKRKKKKPARNWYAIGGYAMLAWAAVNSLLSMYRYGIDQGMYWWFCNLAMIGVGAAMVAQHRGWLVGFLAIASFTQTFWIIDNIWRVTVGENLLGLVEFMYQPGNPMDEFLVSHYHFFIIPTGVLALLFLKKKHDLPVWAVIATNAGIFGASYFLFPAEQNVNCIHEPCLWSLEHWRGPTYSIVFSSSVCAGCLFISWLAKRGLDRLKMTKWRKTVAIRAYAVTCGLALVLTVVDVAAKVRMPSFACDEVVGAPGQCRYTLEDSPETLRLVVKMENPELTAATCRAVVVQGPYEEKLAEERFALEAGESRDIRFLVPYPKEDVRARVVTRCTEYSRGTASQSP